MNSNIEDLAERYPDIPMEVIIKEDLLRRGMAWAPEALEVAAGFKLKAYFICSFDMVPISEMGQKEHLKAPEEIRLIGGARNFRPVIVSVRLNPSSPYRVESDDGSLVLKHEGDPVAQVELQKLPEYYERNLANGKPIADIAPTIEWGYLLYLTAFRLCQYFGAQEECQFCDINENYRQQTKSGRPYTSVKSVEEIIEALEIIAATDNSSKAYTVTGGSITGYLEGKSEVDFYIRYPEAIEKRWPGRWISKIVVQALPKDEVKRLRDAGVITRISRYGIGVCSSSTVREKRGTSAGTNGCAASWTPPTFSALRASYPILLRELKWLRLRDSVRSTTRFIRLRRGWSFS